jgi:hypothetical protein
MLKERSVDPFALAESMWKSGMFKDVKSAGQALVKILAGQEYGLGPVASLQQFHAMNGKVTPSAQLIAAKIKQTGLYRYRVVVDDNTRCELEWSEMFDGSWQIIGVSLFTIEEAAAAGLVKEGSGWEKYPSDMLFARALTRGARRFAPDAFGGSPIYTAEELGAHVDDDGNVVAQTPDPVVIPAPQSVPAASKRESLTDRADRVLRELNVADGSVNWWGWVVEQSQRLHGCPPEKTNPVQMGALVEVAEARLLELVEAAHSALDDHASREADADTPPLVEVPAEPVKSLEEWANEHWDAVMRHATDLGMTGPGATAMLAVAGFKRPTDLVKEGDPPSTVLVDEAVRVLTNELARRGGAA